MGGNMRKRVVPRNIPGGKLPRVVLPKSKYKELVQLTRWLELTPKAIVFSDRDVDHIDEYLGNIVGPHLPEGWGVLSSQFEDRDTMCGGEHSVYGPGVRAGALTVLLAHDDDDTCSEVHVRVESK